METSSMKSQILSMLESRTDQIVLDVTNTAAAGPFVKYMRVYLRYSRVGFEVFSVDSDYKKYTWACQEDPLDIMDLAELASYIAWSIRNCEPLYVD